MKTYRHLFFDLDHTLWDFDLNAKHSLADLFSKHALQNLLQCSFTDFYTDYLIHNTALWASYEEGRITVDELKWKRMWRTLLNFKNADEKLARLLSVEFLEILPTKKALFPETTETLDYLRQKNYQLHLITNGFKLTQQQKLINSGLEKYFIEVITSESSNSMKPKREIFDFALDITKASLNESIMIGDNLNADIKGANNVGMDSIYVNHVKSNLIHTATYQITHFNQLKNIL